MALLSPLATEIVIPVCALVGIAYSYYLVRRFLKSRKGDELDEDELWRLEWAFTPVTPVKYKCAQIKQELSEVAKAFLLTECLYGGVFMVAFAILIFLCLGSVEGFSTQSQPCRLDPSNMCKPALATAVFSAVSFLLGAFTSVLSGFLGMQIAIYAYSRTALGTRNVVGKAFWSGVVMGFHIAANGLLVLYIAINLFKLYYGNDWEGLFEVIAGYCLGVSSMALFGRGTGGIYAEAAHVYSRICGGMDFYHKAVICFPVGDIFGDIFGDIPPAGTDLFGSYAESSCAALVVASISSFGNDHNFTAMCYPLLISSMGILVCLMTTLFTASFSKIQDGKEIKPALRKQLFNSTILMTFGIVIVNWIALPSSFTVYNFGSQKVVKNWQLCFCVGVGLWAGLIIEFITKLFTNDDISRCQEFAAERVGFGLAFVNIPIFAFLSILLSYRIASVYGIAVAAVGMLSTIANRLAINAFSLISDIAKRINGRYHHDERAIIGKVFAIESTSLVSMALFGAFVSRADVSPVDVLTPKVFTGSILGAMLPYWFSAMTMKRVRPAALEMIARISRESDNDRRFFKIPIDASFKGMIRPVAFVMLTPLIVGTFLGVEMLSGVLAGSLGSVVRIAISASNAGGAWEEAKKYIKAGASACLETLWREESMICRTANESDTIGHPLEDTSGPSLNILIQLMAIESLVFAPFFTTHGGLLFKIF